MLTNPTCPAPDHAILVTEDEAARLLRISKQHLRDLVREGVLPAPRLRGHRCTRHSLAVLTAWAATPALASAAS